MVKIKVLEEIKATSTHRKFVEPLHTLEIVTTNSNRPSYDTFKRYTEYRMYAQLGGLVKVYDGDELELEQALRRMKRQVSELLYREIRKELHEILVELTYDRKPRRDVEARIYKLIEAIELR